MDVETLKPEPGFPVKKTSMKTADGKIMINVFGYTDRFFVMIYSVDSAALGSIFEMTKETGCGVDLDSDNNLGAIYKFTIRFGAETPELLLIGRHLVSKINSDKPVVFSWSIKDFSKDVLKSVSDCIEKLFQQPSSTSSY